MPRPIHAVAMGLQQAKGLRLSGRQFDELVRMLRESGDPEERARELGSMPNGELLELIGERRV